jgi:nucleoside-diphosphate-sugar epimerase
MTESATSGGSLGGARCLVTGAAGFIGRALSLRLSALGADLHRLAREIPDADAIGRWHRCDVADLGQVRREFKTIRPEVVFHLAGRVSGSRDRDLVLPTLTDNLLSTVNVLLEATAAGCSRIVCLGSLQEPDESAFPIPNSPYAASKLAASSYVRMFAELYTAPAVVARPYMVYGPGQLDFAKLVPCVVSRLLNGQAAELSSGLQAFDWVYIDDVASALVCLAQAPAVRGLTVGIGTGRLTSVRDVALAIADRIGSRAGLRLDAIEDRRLEQTRCADVEETARRIGWRAAVSLDEGLDRTIEWYRAYFRARGV